ncbi:hypothetical protein [Nonomuraea sp. NPDC005650]|uniref:hypothetical protein n=1 Tax=Nonomuraea sp. NPDC005650 TaxID=3157045 RepID=UPI0033B11C21
MSNVRVGVTLVWVALYGGLRVYWQLGHLPERLSPAGPDLLVFTGWWAVGLCGAAVAVLAAMLILPRGRVLAGAAWVVGGAFVGSGALLLLDVVGFVLPGLRIPVYPLGALSKAACVGAGVLMWRAARAYPPPRPRTLARTPTWAFVAAYVAVGGCLARILAQAAVGIGGGDPGFEAGFLLAGTVLPLALVHRWGRVWPRWVPVLAGRGVPRRLVLWPGVAVSGGLLAYFGVGLGQMVAERLSGVVPFAGSGLPEVFYWVAVPAYVLWGAGLAVAALAYTWRTRAPARSAADR